jgi:hypothetical protein
MCCRSPAPTTTRAAAGARRSSPTTAPPATATPASATGNSARPALNDAIWLYGSDRDAILAQIATTRGTASCRPGSAGSTTTVIKQLSLYVHALGGGDGGGT